MIHSITHDLSYPEISRSSPKAELTIMSAPQIITPPMPTTQIRGKQVHLTCKVDGNPFPVVAWYKMLTAPRPGQRPKPIQPSLDIGLNDGVSICSVKLINWENL